MTITADLYCEWGGDFQLTAGGDILLAQSWDLTRQSIERFILTNPQSSQPDGTPISADYLFQAEYGLGARQDVGKPFNQNTISDIQQKLYQGILASPNVDQNNPPIITYIQPSPQSIVFTAFVHLLNGQQNSIQLSLP